MATQDCQGKNQDIKEIGGLLGVTHVLEGSVRKAGTSIRVTVQLNPDPFT